MIHAIPTSCGFTIMIQDHSQNPLELAPWYDLANTFIMTLSFPNNKKPPWALLSLIWGDNKEEQI